MPRRPCPLRRVPYHEAVPWRSQGVTFTTTDWATPIGEEKQRSGSERASEGASKGGEEHAQSASAHKITTRAGPHNRSDSQHKHQDEHDTHSSLIEYGLPICALNERSRQKHMIHVRSLLRTSRSRAWPSAVSTFCTVERRCRFRSVAILPVATNGKTLCQYLESGIQSAHAHVRCGMWGCGESRTNRVLRARPLPRYGNDHTAELRRPRRSRPGPNRAPRTAEVRGRG